MKVEWRVVLFLYMIHSVSGHYVFSTLLTGSGASTKAVRRPTENAPVHDITSPGASCNVGLIPATETVAVPAGSTIGFKLEPGKIVYHKGPAAMYLGRAPRKAADWDGSGSRWFKIAEWGATFNPFTFIPFGKDTFTATLPSSVPSGEYLVRIEQWGLHIPGSPEVFIGCAQIKITGGGTGSPTMVSIPGYIAQDDPMLVLDIFWPVPTVYRVPGPAVFSDTSNPAPPQTPPTNQSLVPSKSAKVERPTPSHPISTPLVPSNQTITKPRSCRQRRRKSTQNHVKRLHGRQQHF